MKSLFKYIPSALAIAALGVTMTSCDDWTEPEHVDLNYQTVDQAPGYQKYLENLRAYRSSDHTIIYAWFDNATAAFGSQGMRISAIPDSVDVVVIQNPGQITNQVQADMKKVRDEKGMQFEYCISYQAIRADWTLACEDLAAKRLEWEAENPDTPIPAELEDPDFTSFMLESWTTQLNYFEAAGFDAIMVAYDGKMTEYMDKDELAEYKAQTKAFFGVIESWHQRNPEIAIDYMGKPQYITEEAILNDFRKVFLSESLDATNSNAYSEIYSNAGNSVPDSKIGMAAAFRAIDTNADPKTGFFTDGSLAVNGLAKWVASHKVGAAGVTNVQNDYFVTNGQYSNVRQFIQTINPAAK